MFLWVEASGRLGWVRCDGDGDLREAQPPLDKLEFQTVETCEIRMEPSLLRCYLKDREHSNSPSTAQLPTQTPPASAPLLYLFRFAFLWPAL